MLIDLFLWPGRLAARAFSRDKKRAYRSLRLRPETGGGVFLASLLAWLALAGGLLYALDQAGFLKQALDIGVEAAQGEKPAAVVPAPPRPEAPSQAEVAGGGDAAQGALVHGALSGPADPSAATLETEMWLVILHTIPNTGRAEAERRQAGYRTRGLEVDILDTNAFPKLKSNQWIIALGPFDDRAAALAAADKAKAFNSGLMVRRGL